MIRIKVPATSANFCIGFDTLGVALSIYNEYEFEKTEYDYLEGFDKEFMNETNLVLSSYKAFFREFSVDYIPISIKQIKQNIPTSRGLGSSAACIISGIVAANVISKSNFDNDLLLGLATKIEGHPDNVAPCLLGGFVASINSDKVYTTKYNVSSSLKFNVFIPPTKLSTSEARKVLPKTYTRSDVVYNISRVAQLGPALKSGDLEILKVILDDKIHEPYRIKLIENASKLKEELKKEEAITVISGSGSTMISISKDDIKYVSKDFKKVKVHIDRVGARIYD